METPLHKRTLTLLILAIAFSLAVLSDSRREQDKELLGKAIEYYQGRKYHECILTFERLRRHYQLNPRFTAYLGFSYYKERQYEEAVACLREGIPSLSVYSPREQAVYLYACAESLFLLGQYSEALPYYTQALPMVSGCDAADVNYHMGFAYYMQMPPDTYSAYQHLTTANEQYVAASHHSPLDELHSARLAQTTTMLRALKQYFEPTDTVLTDTIPTDTLTEVKNP